MTLAIGELGLSWLASDTPRDEVDVASLVHAHAALLYRLAYSVVRSPAEAEDIVQETFLRALEHRSRLPELAQVRAWLVRVAWNLALDCKRRPGPAQLDETLASAISSAELPAERQLAAASELAHVLAVVDTLPPPERAVLLLSAVDELTVTEIAAILHRSESSIRSLTFRARAHLEERLRDPRRQRDWQPARKEQR